MNADSEADFEAQSELAALVSLCPEGLAVIDPAGGERPAHPGAPVYAGDRVVAPHGAAAAVTLRSGETLEIPGGAGRVVPGRRHRDAADRAAEMARAMESALRLLAARA
jgi:hypothetical protein